MSVWLGVVQVTLLLRVQRNPTLGLHVGGEVSFLNIFDRSLGDHGEESAVVGIAIILPIDWMGAPARFGFKVGHTVSKDHASCMSSSASGFLAFFKAGVARDPRYFEIGKRFAADRLVHLGPQVNMVFFDFILDSNHNVFRHVHD